MMKQELNFFHIRVVSKHIKIDTLFASASQTNLISKDLLKKLNLVPLHIQFCILSDGYVRISTIVSRMEMST